jgi:hypothetical protein
MTIETDAQRKAIEGLTEKCTLIPDCPQLKGALTAIGEYLIEVCIDEDEAKSLVHEACLSWDNWHGIAGLRRLRKFMRDGIEPSDERMERMVRKWSAEHSQAVESNDYTK